MDKFRTVESKRIVRRNWGYKGRMIVYLRVLRRREESLFPISSSSSFLFLKMKYDDCIRSI